MGRTGSMSYSVPGLPFPKPRTWICPCAHSHYFEALFHLAAPSSAATQGCAPSPASWAPVTGKTLTLLESLHLVKGMLDFPILKESYSRCIQQQIINKMYRKKLEIKDEM